ncbi:unnamed protein product [Amoebophrya sp. A120]|nr:unnamed protein product [Amoebophrya sp. A120]|eukprot:GSA120T00008043001.1
MPKHKQGVTAKNIASNQTGYYGQNNRYSASGNKNHYNASGYNTGATGTSSSSTSAATERGRFVQSRFRCAVSEETCSYEDVATCLLDVDFLIDWQHVRRVDVLVDASKPLVCSICLESSFQVPRITRCGHCFCYPCATRYLLRDEKTGNLQANLASAAMSGMYHSTNLNHEPGRGGHQLNNARNSNYAGSTSSSSTTNLLTNDLHRLYNQHGVANPATRKTELGRKCPVCKEMCYLGDLRPVRFQYCNMQANKMKKFVRVCKDKERPGITSFAPIKEVEEYRAMIYDCKNTAGVTTTTPCVEEINSRHSIAENFNHEKLRQLPTGLPREQVDPGWYFSRLIVTPEQNLEQERKNDLLGLLKLSDNCRKLRPDNNDTFADTEMLPFLDFLINQELLHFQKFGITTVEEFLNANTLPRRPGKRNLQQLYEDIVYDRKLHEVRIDMDADIMQFTQRKNETSCKDKDDDQLSVEEQAVIVTADDVLVEESVEEEEHEEPAASRTKNAKSPARQIPVVLSDRSDPLALALPSKMELSCKTHHEDVVDPNPNAKNLEDNDDDQWFTERSNIPSSSSSASAVSPASPGGTRPAARVNELFQQNKQEKKSSTAPGAPGTAGGGAQLLAKQKPNHVNNDDAYYFYQAWDSQPVFVAPFFLNILRHDKKLPYVLDVSKISHDIDFENSQHSVNHRLFEQHSDCVTADTRVTVSLFKRLPLKLELSLTEFDVQPFVSEATYQHFSGELARRQHEKQRNKKRQKADEKWVREKAKNADEKLMEELKKRSWMVSPHANFSNAVPTASDFDLSLEVSKKVAEFEARTKRKIDDEELAKIISAHELEMEEKAKIEAQQREIKRQREEEERMRKAKEKAMKVRDAWGSSDEEDIADSTGAHQKSVLEKMLFANSSSAGVDKGRLKWEKDLNTEGATTMAQKIREKKIAENKKKKEEEANQKYFPSLAESLGGNKGMVSLGGNKTGNKSNTKVTRSAVFGGNKEPQPAAPSTSSTGTNPSSVSSPPAGAPPGAAINTSGLFGAGAASSPASNAASLSAPFSPEMKSSSSGATSDGFGGPSSPTMPASCTGTSPHLAATAAPSESEEHSATGAAGATSAGAGPPGAGNIKSGKKKKPQKIRLFG